MTGKSRMAWADPFRASGRTELFADSSAERGAPIRVEHLASNRDDFGATASLRRMRNTAAGMSSKIDGNPLDGTVHTREKGKPWKTYWEGRVAKDEAKAHAEQRDKRLWGLAKQATAGLQHSFGVKYGVSELKMLLGEALDEIEEDAEERSEPQATIYKAVMKHDMPMLAQAMELQLASGEATVPGYSRTVGGRSLSVYKSSLADVHNPSFPKGLGRVT